MKKKIEELRERGHRGVLAMLWIALAANLVVGFAHVVPFAFGTLSVLVLLLFWVHWNKCLGLVGSALSGALILSAALDFFFAVGWKAGTLPPLQLFVYFVAPALGVLVGLSMLFFSGLMLSSRWIVFGLVCMFLIRALATAPSHHQWSNQLSDDFGQLLRRAGLEVNVNNGILESDSYPLVSEQEMPCGLMNFSVSSKALNAQKNKVQLYIKECGFHPQGLSIEGGSFTVEVHNALPRALELRVSAQSEGGDYAPVRSFVVPPDSYIEVADLEVPRDGALLVYAPLEINLGATLLSDPSIGTLWRVSREPLQLERQYSVEP